MSLFKKKSLTVNCVVLSFESVLPLFTQVLWPRPFGNSILHFHLQNGITESTNLTGCWGASEALCGVCLARSLQSLVLSECLPSLLRNVTTILCPSYITSQHSFTSSRPEPNDVPGEEPIPLLLLFSCSVVSDSLWPMDCSTPGLPVFHHLPERAQTHVHWVGDAIQPSHPILLLLPSVFPNIRVFFSELALSIKWPKHWSLSFSISPSSAYLGPSLKTALFVGRLEQSEEARVWIRT